MITENDFIVILCGSRTWTDLAAVRREVARLKVRYGDRLLIRHGDADGADTAAYAICEELTVRHIEYCARKPRHGEHGMFQVIQVSDWKKDGRAAGPIRNRAMRDAGAHGLVAFRMAGVSRGTDGMVELARAANIPVIIRHA